MKRRIVSILLILCMVMCIMPYTAAASDNTHKVTVSAGTGGKVSTDGQSWENSVTVQVEDGSAIGDKVKYRADNGYELDRIISSNIVEAAGGLGHTVFLDKDGQVWTVGDNGWGALGRPDGVAWKAAKVTVGTGNVKIKTIAAGARHTVLLDENGDVWTTGSNSNGQLGRTITTGYDKNFAKVTVGTGDVKIKAIAAGPEHTVLVDTDGKVWTAGKNDVRQLGRKTNRNNPDPNFEHPEGDINNVKVVAASAGIFHTVLLDENGNVWVAGQNVKGQLGIDQLSQSVVFKQVTVGTGDVKIKAISAGSEHTVLLDTDGKVWTAGSNKFGQLGRTTTGTENRSFAQVTDGIGNAKIKAVSVGQCENLSKDTFYPHTVLLDTDGKVWTAGSNKFGQLCRTTVDLQDSTFGQATDGIGNNTISSIATVQYHYTLLVDSNGGAWAAGRNYYGQLGRKANTYTDNANQTLMQITEDLAKNFTIEEMKSFVINSDCAFNLMFKERTKINVNYSLAGGNWIDGYSAPEFYYEGDAFEAPAADKLKRNGYTFSKWTISGQNPKIYTAVWTIKGEYTVNYDTDGGSTVSDSTNVKWTDRVLDGVAAPTKNGWTFLGWKCGDTTVTNTTTYADLASTDTVLSVTLKAQWTIKDGYTVKFDTDGGSTVSDSTNVKWTDRVLDGVAAPTKNGWTFLGWKCGDTTVTDTTTYADLASTDTAMSVTLKAQWKDIEEPTGEIGIGTNKWNKFLNTITFGLFFKDTQQVEISATDNSGEAVTVKYYLSSTKLDKTELSTKTFTDYSGAFSIDPDNKYIIYAKLTDKAGNTRYICSQGIVLDGTDPVIGNIEEGKTYCEAQTVTVTDENIDEVTVNETKVTLDSNNKFTLSPKTGTQKIVVTDKAGNTAEMTVTVNDDHTFEWQSANGQYWQKCKFCGHETAKKDIPEITVNGAKRVCRTQDYTFSFTLPAGCTNPEFGYEFTNMGDGGRATVKNGVCTGTVESDWYDENEDSFVLTVYVTTSDGYTFGEATTVSILNKHIGGTATCTQKAKCEVCGVEYGDVDPDNHTDTTEWSRTETKHKQTYKCCGATVVAEEDHEWKNGVCEECGYVCAHTGGKATCTQKAKCAICGNEYGNLDQKNHENLKHIDAKAATGDSQGNIEYWVCEGCNKYYSDAAATKEITKEETVTNKLPKGSKSPKTGDSTNLALWIAILFISGGVLTGTTVIRQKKKRSER